MTDINFVIGPSQPGSNPNGRGQLGFGVNFTPSVTGYGTYTSAQGYYPEVYPTFGIMDHPRFRSFKLLYEYWALTGVDIKLIPRFNTATASNRNPIVNDGEFAPWLQQVQFQPLHSWLEMSTVDQKKFKQYTFPGDISPEAWPYSQGYEATSPFKQWHRYVDLRKYAADPNNAVNWIQCNDPKFPLTSQESIDNPEPGYFKGAYFFRQEAFGFLADEADVNNPIYLPMYEIQISYYITFKGRRELIMSTILKAAELMNQVDKPLPPPEEEEPLEDAMEDMKIKS